jgi:hypothetical protein
VSLGASFGRLPAADVEWAGGDGLVYEPVVDEASWDRLAPAWDEAAARTQAFYLSHDWLASWWAAYGHGRLAAGAVRAGDRLVALAPLRRLRRRFWGMPARVVSNLFNAHACRSDVALLERDSEALDLVLQALDGDPWDVVFLREIPEHSRFLKLLPEAAGARGWGFHSRWSLDSPCIPIAGDWNAFFANRPARFHKQLRNKQNRLRKSGVRVEIECVASADRIEGVMPQVMGVAERSWSGQRGSSIASPPNRGFYEDVIRRFARQGRLRVWTLRIGGALAAFEVHIVWGRTAAVLKACYDPAFTSLSVGSILEAHVTKELFQSGEFDACDLLGKDDFNKTRWTEMTVRHVEVFLFNGRPFSRLLRLLEFGLRPSLSAVRKGSRRLVQSARSRASKAGGRR